MSKTQNRSRNFCITANHQGEEENLLNEFKNEKNVEKLWPKTISNFIVLQIEKGESGTPHIQAYIELKQQMTFSAFQKKLNETSPWWENCHIEQCKKEKASIAYCTKQESRLLGPWRFGTPKEAGKRTDLIEVCDSIEKRGLKPTILEYKDMYVKYHRGMEKLADFLAEHNAEKFEQPNVYILYGRGGTGKTKTVYDKYNKDEVARAMYQKDGDSYKIWFQNYNYQPCILFDEFSDIKCPIDLLKMYTDGYPCDLNIKGTSKQRCGCKDIYILTNKDPKTWYTAASEEDREALKRRITKIVYYEKDKAPVDQPIGDFF